jgi:hypothetical protein
LIDETAGFTCDHDGHSLVFGGQVSLVYFHT